MCALEYGLLSCFPSLLIGQLDNLEKVQRKATRIIMGLSPFRKPGDPTYEEHLSHLKIECLASRTKRRFDVFCKKLENDRRMANYIQKREQLTNVTLRNRKPYKEIKARTAKYYRAPMNHVVRRLNQLHIQPPTSTP